MMLDEKHDVRPQCCSLLHIMHAKEILISTGVTQPHAILQLLSSCCARLSRMGVTQA